MTDASKSRTKLAAVSAVLILSASTMVWLLWHYPIITSLATVAILAGLAVCARLTRLTDSERPDLRSNQGA